MRKGLLVALFLVLAASFMVGAFYSTAEAKVISCDPDKCIDGVLQKCCYIIINGAEYYRCKVISPVTPCE